MTDSDGCAKASLFCLFVMVVILLFSLKGVAF